MFLQGPWVKSVGMIPFVFTFQIDQVLIGAQTKSRQQSMLKQIGLFGLVGIANTAIDFAIFNLLTMKSVGWNRLAANCVATSVAMTFSFVMNLTLIFPVKNGELLPQSLKFIAITASSLYIVQNLIIYAGGHYLKPYSNTLRSLIDRLPVACRPESDLVERNVLKLLAVGASFICNYVGYKYVVFT